MHFQCDFNRQNQDVALKFFWLLMCFKRQKKSRDCLYFFFLGTRNKNNFEYLSFENTSKIRNTSKQRRGFVCRSQIEKACSNNVHFLDILSLKYQHNIDVESTCCFYWSFYDIRYFLLFNEKVTEELDPYIFS